MSTRREKIEAMLADEPQDIFLRYSLAMELDKEGAHPASLERLAELYGEDPPYVPAYFMAGQQLVRSNESTRPGPSSATESSRPAPQGDAHAAGEMSEFLASLGSLGE